MKPVSSCEFRLSSCSRRREEADTTALRQAQPAHGFYDVHNVHSVHPVGLLTSAATARERERTRAQERFYLAQKFRNASGHAFTLIELLVVVAVMGILGSAFFTVVMFTIRAEVEDGVRSTLRQEGLNVVRAMLRDAHHAQPSGSKPLPAAVHSDSQTLVLHVGQVANLSRIEPLIVYRIEGERLKRIKWDDVEASPTVQTLSEHVRSCRIERSGGLLRVQLELALNRWTKTFSERYEFTTALGGIRRAGQITGAQP